MNRQENIQHLLKLSRPIWTSAAEGKLQQNMSFEGPPERRSVTLLEAIGRNLAGLGPWLELDLPEGSEHQQQQELLSLVKKGLEELIPCRSKTLLFSGHNQAVVDAAFLVQGFMRAPKLWQALPKEVKTSYLEGLNASRSCQVSHNNWVLFAAMVELFLWQNGPHGDEIRFDYAITSIESWYLGDGFYGDGPHFANDYYNSFVIHPMYIDLLNGLQKLSDRWEHLRQEALQRARRYASHQEQCISPDGSYPPTGRSITYRCGAFHLLAQAVLRDDLPEGLSRGMCKRGLGRVILKTLTAANTYDENGWLLIGLCGHQPELGECYISTGSLYMATLAFLPLGLSPEHPYWTCHEEAISQERTWQRGFST